MMRQRNKRTTRAPGRSNKPGRDGDLLVKRLTLPGSVVASTAGNIIAVDTTSDTALVQSAPATEWASFAARYQQYRVRSITMILEPLWPGSGSPTIATTAHDALYVSDYIGTSVPGSAAQVLSDEGAVVTNTSRVVKYTVDWARNPNAKLWNPTSGALPAPNSFGIAFASAGVTLPASTTMFIKTLMWEVEFRGSQ